MTHPLSTDPTWRRGYVAGLKRALADARVRQNRELENAILSDLAAHDVRPEDVAEIGPKQTRSAVPNGRRRNTSE